jgi:hypothetical protein
MKTTDNLKDSLIEQIMNSSEVNEFTSNEKRHAELSSFNVIQLTMILDMLNVNAISRASL